VLGEDLQGEAPYVQAQLVRGQHQRGLHLTIAHPRRVKLAREKFGGDWLGYRPGSERALLAGLVRAALAGPDPTLPEDALGGLADLRRSLEAWTPERIAEATGLSFDVVQSAGERLRKAERKAIVFGRGIAEHPEAAALLRAIETLGWASGALTAEASQVMYVGSQNDSQGALDMGLTPDRLPGYLAAGDPSARGVFEPSWGATLPAGPGLAAPEILKAAAEGRIKALWVTSDHWLRSAPDRALVDAALGKLELLIVSDLFLTETAERAHVVFPAVSFAEKEGVVVNCERRLQRCVRALHPRRGARTDWEILQAVAQAMGARWSYRSAEDVFREIARLVPIYGGLSWGALLAGGHAWSSNAPLVPPSLAPFDAPPSAEANGRPLWLLSGGVLFLQGSLSHHTELLPRLAKEARAALHPDEARRLGVEDGERVEIEGPGGSLTLPARIDAEVPRGSVFVPYAYAEVELNRLGAPSGSGLRVEARKAALVTS
jgi:predicted molibdopterin-dependent oxidoreductase YjgC